MGVAGAGEPAVLVEPVLGRGAERVDVAGGQRRDEQRGAADVEHGVLEGDLFGQHAPGAGRRAFLVPGTHTTTASSRASGIRTARRPATATTPPYSDAATLSA